jgi:predicted nucleic-acid-binding Zn-ribbon protein
VADFCKQCSIEIFGEDHGDLKGIGEYRDKLPDIDNSLGWFAICEGCGYTIVDDDGQCISKDCRIHRT